MNNRDTLRCIVHDIGFKELMKFDVKDLRFFQVPVMGDDDPLRPKLWNWVTTSDQNDLIRMSDIRTNLIDAFVYRYYSPQQYHADLKSVYIPDWSWKHWGVMNTVLLYRNYKKADEIIEFLYEGYLDTIRNTRKRFDKHGITPWERMLAEELEHE